MLRLNNKRAEMFALPLEPPRWLKCIQIIVSRSSKEQYNVETGDRRDSVRHYKILRLVDVKGNTGRLELFTIELL